METDGNNIIQLTNLFKQGPLNLILVMGNNNEWMHTLPVTSMVSKTINSIISMVIFMAVRFDFVL